MSETKDEKPKAGETDTKVTSPAAEQDSRIAKQKAEAEAEAKGGGARKSEQGLNQDG